MREAQEVIAHADSLREAHLYAQNEYDDSLSLAQAYETLKEIPLPFRGWLGLNSSYAHACYHYGRLLRAKENYVEAMKVFIDATHSRTRDYRILGRIYNNMGDMAHLAGDYALSYDMFAISADCFLQNGDTINYYYGLNDMALELAEQGKKDSTLLLINKIENRCTDNYVLLKTLETKAIACKMVQQYDSTIYYTSQAFKHGYYTPTIILNRAQGYSLMGQKDSAVYYANILLKNNSDVYNQCNALYILTNDDDSQNTKEIRRIAAERADSQKIIEDRKGELANAVQLLEQDLVYRSKHKTRVIYTILILAVVLVALFVITQNIRKKRNRFIQEKKDSLYQLEQKNSMHSKRVQTMHAEIENRCNILLQSPDLKKELCWKEYKQMCRMVDQQFYLFASKLQKEELKEREVRLCLLVFLNLTHAQIAELMYVEENSVGKLKERAAKRLSTSRKNMRKKLLNMIVGEDL